MKCIRAVRKPAPVVKLGGGILMLAFASVLVGWIAYNLLVERQSRFAATLGGCALLVALVGVGSRWVAEGRSARRERRPSDG